MLRAKTGLAQMVRPLPSSTAVVKVASRGAIDVDRSSHVSSLQDSSRIELLGNGPVNRTNLAWCQLISDLSLLNFRAIQARTRRLWRVPRYELPVQLIQGIRELEIVICLALLRTDRRHLGRALGTLPVQMARELGFAL